jgi:hypothetical protein
LSLASKRLPDRQRWLSLLWRMAEPVLTAGAEGRLQSALPVHPVRARFSALEAFARTLCGLAPWLELEGLEGDEAELQRRARGLAVASLDRMTRAESDGGLNFSQGDQPLVDAAFLALALLRASRVLWQGLSDTVQGQVKAALGATRRIVPHENNWLLFPALIEAWFRRIGEPCDEARITLALEKMNRWHVGDGLYADGPFYRWDYYNSFVIHPLLLEIGAAADAIPAVRQQAPVLLARAQRHGEQLERMISPEGTMPLAGRSLAYRCGNLHLPALLAWRGQLPVSLPPAQLRCAMHAVIVRTLAVPGTFDAQGWLRVGLCGDQPALAEDYISTGSLYLACCAFLPLGLAPGAPFWTGAAMAWTSQRAYAGQDFQRDQALPTPGES